MTNKQMETILVDRYSYADSGSVKEAVYNLSNVPVEVLEKIVAIKKSGACAYGALLKALCKELEGEYNDKV